MARLHIAYRSFDRDLALELKRELEKKNHLVTIDVAWTPQHRILPNALRMLKPGGRIVTLTGNGAVASVAYSAANPSWISDIEIDPKQPLAGLGGQQYI